MSSAKKRKHEDLRSEGSLSESGKSSAQYENGGLKKREEKRQRKMNNSEPLYLPQYKQVNYMEMLTDIISNDFIDDRLTKFLHILNGTTTSVTSPLRPRSNSPILSPGTSQQQKQAAISPNPSLLTK